MLRVIVLAALLVFSLRWIDPPRNYYQFSEVSRLGAIEQDWVPITKISPDMQRAVVAAEDANFCHHFGVDFEAIQNVIASGARGGASTITQQTVKNVLLWPARSYVRKFLEAGISLFVDIAWGKVRVLEIYLNVAEFDEGVFGVQAAAKHHFGVDANELTLDQSARLAMVLPNPKNRSATRLSNFGKGRVQSIKSGSNTIAKDGRDQCFIR